MGSALRRIVRSLLVVISTLILVEVLLHLIGVNVPPAPLYPGDIVHAEDSMLDPDLGWKLPPNSEGIEKTVDYEVPVRANAQGFRSSHDFAAPKTHPRIVFLGDSFTQGSGVL